ncbi:hypothetical protein VOM14_03940 [Paraburkholderia sp. MPAMCS5]|uniref:hypothetical protein n=1 Tax=Paraburkholderia sp. MPAMCS5 TaxID=3112563 RepID=UPI002E183F82|nr:hypothetical protein [Paraburkholderia sp. MPAMCS5]
MFITLKSIPIALGSPACSSARSASGERIRPAAVFVAPRIYLPGGHLRMVSGH